MLTIYGSKQRFCDGISRRNFLKIGALGLGGLSLPQLLQAEAIYGIVDTDRATTQYSVGAYLLAQQQLNRAEAPLLGHQPHCDDRHGELEELAVDFVAIDAESTVETIADGVAPHPTLSEAIKEAGLVALGRAIHVPNRKPRAKATA